MKPNADTLDDLSRQAAQRRADAIRLFREELMRVEDSGAIALSPEQRERIDAYHRDTLNRLTTQYDIDRTEAQRQLSLGMRIASFLGAVALSAAVALFFYRIWGFFSTAGHVAILTTGPLLAVAAMEVAARRERTLYFTSLLGLVAFGCVVLDVWVLGSIFNVRPTQNIFLVWGAFALLLAYAYGLKLLLVAGVVCWMAFVAALAAIAVGAAWPGLLQRPESFMVAGVVCFALAAAPAHARRPQFGAVYRVLGAVGLLVPVLVLADWGAWSYLPLSRKTVEAFYQGGGVVLGVGLTWTGLRKPWREVVNTATAFLAIFLVVRFFDWWWDWMPRYLFFLILGLVAVGFLVAMNRIRAHQQERSQ